MKKVKGGEVMIILGVLIFAVVTFFTSFLLGRIKDFDKGKVATYVTLIAWGSLLYGLYLSKSVR
jgi:hypothetical protein